MARVTDVTRKECPAKSEFPQGIEIQSFADFGHARATQNPQKLFAIAKRTWGSCDKLRPPDAKHSAALFLTFTVSRNEF